MGWDVAYNSSDVAAVIGSFIGPAGSGTITKGTDSVATTVDGTTLFGHRPLDEGRYGQRRCAGCLRQLPERQTRAHTDGDTEGDACDSDDDNDIDNSPDDCPRRCCEPGLNQNDDPANSTDWDRDDKDDVEDAEPTTTASARRRRLSPFLYQPRPTWTSDGQTDVDGDGCRDADEDTDDDADGFEDVSDDCPTVFGNSTLGEKVGQRRRMVKQL